MGQLHWVSSTTTPVSYKIEHSKMSSISSASSTFPLSESSTCIYCDSVITVNEHTFKDCIKELSINIKCVYSDEKRIDDIVIAERIHLLRNAIIKRELISDELCQLINLYNLDDENEEEECKHQPNENNNTLFDVEIGYLHMLDDALKAELDLNYELAVTNYSKAIDLMLITHKLMKSNEKGAESLMKKVDYYLQKAEELKKKIAHSGGGDTKSSDLLESQTIPSDYGCSVGI